MVHLVSVNEHYKNFPTLCSLFSHFELNFKAVTVSHFKNINLLKVWSSWVKENSWTFWMRHVTGWNLCKDLILNTLIMGNFRWWLLNKMKLLPQNNVSKLIWVQIFCIWCIGRFWRQAGLWSHGLICHVLLLVLRFSKSFTVDLSKVEISWI